MRRLLATVLATGLCGLSGTALASETTDSEPTGRSIQIKGRQVVWVADKQQPAYALTGESATKSREDRRDSPRFIHHGRAGTKFQRP